MAVVYAVVNGNWGTGTTWNTGTVPTAADDVYLNNKAVTLDVDVTIANLYMIATTGVVVGGTLTSTTTRSLTCNTIYPYSTSTTIYHAGLAGTTLTITANLVGSTFNSGGTSGVLQLGAGNIIFNGNITMTNGHPNAGAYLNGSGLFTLNGNANGSNYYALNILGTSRAVINGTVGTTAAAGTAVIVNSTSVSALTINGVCIAGSSAGIQNNNVGTVTINGNQIASGTTGVYGILNSSSGIININGDCLGSLSGTPSTALIVNNASTGIVNINGSVIQRSIGPSASIGIVNNASTGTININGNVGGGTVASSIGVSNSSTGTINVTGSVSGGTNATMTPAIYSTTAGIITVTGNTISGLHPAIYSTSTTAIHRLYGNLVSANGIFPIYGLTTPLSIRISPSVAQTITLQDSSNVNRAFDTSTTTTGLPAASNVRRGTSYGNINQYTGTMYVPTPDNVRKSVLTDNTVGTADLSVSSLIDTLTGSTNPMAVRLRNVSTAQITGSQISGLLNNP